MTSPPPQQLLTLVGHDGRPEVEFECLLEVLLLGGHGLAEVDVLQQEARVAVVAVVVHRLPHLLVGEPPELLQMGQRRADVLWRTDKITAWLGFITASCRQSLK